MAQRWATKRKTSKASWKDDKPKAVYELVCVLIVIAAIIYAVITGTAPENNGFD